jgi:hypothetical protein
VEHLENTSGTTHGLSASEGELPVGTANRSESSQPDQSHDHAIDVNVRNIHVAKPLAVDPCAVHVVPSVCPHVKPDLPAPPIRTVQFQGCRHAKALFASIAADAHQAALARSPRKGHTKALPNPFLFRRIRRYRKRHDPTCSKT